MYCIEGWSRAKGLPLAALPCPQCKLTAAELQEQELQLLDRLHGEAEARRLALQVLFCRNHPYVYLFVKRVKIKLTLLRKLMRAVLRFAGWMEQPYAPSSKSL